MRSKFGIRLALIMQGFMGWAFLCGSLSSLQRMSLRYQDVLIGRDRLFDWLAPLGAAAFALGWIISHSVDLAKKRRSVKLLILPISLLIILSVSVLAAVIFANVSWLAQDGILMFFTFLASGFLFRMAASNYAHIGIKEMRRAQEQD